MTAEQMTLAMTAVGIGVVHTLLGPDHYLPLIALARSRCWSGQRTMVITLSCGLGHVAGSVLLGVVGLSLGWALRDIAWWETARASVAGWLLLGFGLAYFAWGLRQGLRKRPHCHPHLHADGTLHRHPHNHLGTHAHPHQAATKLSFRGLLTGRFAGATAWALFVIFILGPCEPLIPLLLYPAATGSPASVALVATLFALATLTTMSIVVLLGRRGLAQLPAGSWERWAHAAAGAIVVACALAVQFGL